MDSRTCCEVSDGIPMLVHSPNPPLTSSLIQAMYLVHTRDNVPQMPVPPCRPHRGIASSVQALPDCSFARGALYDAILRYLCSALC